MTSAVGPSPAAPFSASRAYARLDTRPAATAGHPFRPAPLLQPVGLPTAPYPAQHRLTLLWSVLILALLGALLAASWSILQPALFTASTDLLAAPIAGAARAQTTGDARSLGPETKRRMLLSTNVLNQVVVAQALAEDAEFGGDNAGLPSQQQAVSRLAERINVTSAQDAGLLSLSVTTGDGAKSVAIAQALTAAFEAELARFDAAQLEQRANALRGELEHLRSDAQAAETALQSFRREHAPPPPPPQPAIDPAARVALEHDLAAVSQELEQAQRRRDVLRQAAAGTLPEEPVWAPTLAPLQAHLLDLQARINTADLILGPRHPTMLDLQFERDLAQARFTEEARRLLTRASAAAASARTRRDDLAARLAALPAAPPPMPAGRAQDDGELQKLERDAARKRGLYQTFLSQAAQLSHGSDAPYVQVLSPPRLVSGNQGQLTPPLLLLLGAAAGALVGWQLSAWRTRRSLSH
ncbi:MAG: lipopolysaccharide biosynthesis protein [Devosia sp.]|nr:lipopolysaccharide biosynthesis protein [Devosia sp.]